MSTFNGTFEEIPLISVDRFDGENLFSECFFLSHCHMDHMIGLDNPNGLPKTLYTSEISEIFVRKQYMNIRDIKTLKIGVPTEINSGSSKIIVTTVPAGHCPGSVMFIFETNHKRILYTGDFRIPIKELKNLKSFKSSSGVLSFDAIYFDSTFFNKEYHEFPAQTESSKRICQLIREWITRGPLYLVSLRIPARFGSEFLFIEIAKSMNIKIHVKESEFRKYCYIPEMDNCVTKDSSTTQVHACTDNFIKDYKTLNCQNNPNYKLRVIRPSALIWRKWNNTKDIVQILPNEIYRVCYSNHVSYTEIRDMILYLKPRKIKMNVIPEKESEKIMMKNCLREIMDSYLDNNLNSESRTEIKFSFENIKSSFQSTQITKSKKCFSDSDEDKECAENRITVKRMKR